MKNIHHILCLFCIAVFALPDPAFAYIGPGAGFAFVGSTFVFILTIGMAVLTLLLWPLRFVWRLVRRKGIPKNARARKVVVVGLDGLDPNLLDSYLEQGKLPTFATLKEEGSYRRLATTLPALSPVAWSTFQTGVNPGAHNIFDFLTRDKRHCLPLLSSTAIEEGIRKTILGIPLWKSNPTVRIMRKSQPFWKILGKHGIFSNIIRVPISFPPERFDGNILSAMCTPDLRGTQGTFSYFTTREGAVSSKGDGTTGGENHALQKKGNTFTGILIGPPDPRDSTKNLSITFTFTLQGNGATLDIDGSQYPLTLNQFSSWIVLTFRAGSKSIAGIVRFCLREVGEHTALYVSPINAHPEKPAFPISYPAFFATWLAKKQGLYGTLGLMEDTWGRNELALDDERFLAQAYLTHHEREVMFFEALSKTREGVCACVFDASDRIQHMFWRYLDPKHPSPREDARFDNAIPEMYEKMDGFLARVRAKLSPEDVLIVLSDHGFASFRRGININTWLHEQGYLVLKHQGKTGADYFREVDWTKTKAFAVGLSGLYINQQGREVQGIVSAKAVASLKEEICTKLAQLIDPQDGTKAIRKVYDTEKEYRGIYSKDAPDMIVGYEPGYRVSWESVTGAVEEHIFSNNTKAWSGDHHVDPEAVPGILLSNRKIIEAKPHIRDLAPSILDLFAVPVPPYMEGKVII